MFNASELNHSIFEAPVFYYGCSFSMLPSKDCHKIQKRANPQYVMRYRLSIQLFKIFSDEILNDDWLDLNFEQNVNARMMCVQINYVPRLKIGKNMIMNRLGIFLWSWAEVYVMGVRGTMMRSSLVCTNSCLNFHFSYTRHC